MEKHELRRGEVFRHSISDLRTDSLEKEKENIEQLKIVSTEQITDPPKLYPDSNDLPKNLRVRNKVINEILITERGYVHDLDVLTEAFSLPLKNSNLITVQQFSGIFSNLETILGK